jgi:hypothetical protein
MSTPAPSILVNGKKITLPKPKIKLWRQLIAFSEKQNNGELDAEETFDVMLDIVVGAFNHPDITKDVIEENLDMDDLNAIFVHIKSHVQGLAMLKGQQFPNGKTPAGRR